MILKTYLTQRSESFFNHYEKADSQLNSILNHLKSNGLPKSYGIQVSQEGGFEFYDENEEYDGAPSNWGLEEIIAGHLIKFQ